MSSQPPPDQPGGSNPPGGWQPPPPAQPAGGSPGGWQPSPPPQQPSPTQPPSATPGSWQPPAQPGWQPSPPPSAPPGAQPGYQPVPPAPGYPYGTPSWATGVSVGRPAGFWIRVVAYIIDIVIVGIVNVVWTFIVTLAAGGSITGPPAVLVDLIDTLVGVAYFSYFWSSRGQTVGMMATNLRVTRSDGSPLTLGRAIGRIFALYLSFLIVFIGVIMVAFTQRKRGLHDMIADTVVVHVN